MARYTPARVEKLMADAGIIRNRAKIEASVISARAYLDLSEKEDFASFVWGFVDGEPVQNRWRERGEVPAETELSRKLSKALLEKGFKFCGPTIVYAFMQAVGMVNDHYVGCHRHAACAALAKGAGAKAKAG
jgi:DNA-3-methyladenine glycosylase I